MIKLITIAFNVCLAALGLWCSYFFTVESLSWDVAADDFVMLVMSSTTGLSMSVIVVVISIKNIYSAK